MCSCNIKRPHFDNIICGFAEKEQGYHFFCRINVHRVSDFELNVHIYPLPFEANFLSTSVKCFVFPIGSDHRNLSIISVVSLF